MIKHRIDRNIPPPEICLEYGAGVNLENKSDKLVHKELFDGATLIAKYMKISIYVNTGSRVYTITASLV